MAKGIRENESVNSCHKARPSGRRFDVRTTEDLGAQSDLEGFDRLDHGKFRPDLRGKRMKCVGDDILPAWK